jgi:hypothetical protein
MALGWRAKAPAARPARSSYGGPSAGVRSGSRSASGARGAGSSAVSTRAAITMQKAR